MWFLILWSWEKEDIKFLGMNEEAGLLKASGLKRGSFSPLIKTKQL
jgi:hypothetical protein